MIRAIAYPWTLAALLVTTVFVLPAQADHHKDAEKKDKDLAFIAGKGMCAKCELGQADSCQTAIQVEQDGKKITYLLASNKAAKDYHGTICQSTELTAALGKLQKQDDTTFTVSAEKVKKAQKIEGKAMCARCELGQADDCKTVIQAKNKEGKLITYTLASTESTKDFHKNVCTSVKPVSIIGLAIEPKEGEKDQEPKVMAGQIALVEDEK